jgi:hypothetical protein
MEDALAIFRGAINYRDLLAAQQSAKAHPTDEVS